MELLDKICAVIMFITAILMIHNTVYIAVGFFCRAKKYPSRPEDRRYAVVISARNEEAVIGNLLDSIAEQSYALPVEVFVVADNCDDETARVCREKGAIVYERFSSDKRRKGYALEFLFGEIDRDYGLRHVDGYFIFDADNLLHPDFIREMNRAFGEGSEIVTGYRNTKNFDTNFISSAYGIHFYHNSFTKHRPRSVLGFGTHLTGTGYLISSRLLSDGGWHYVNLTEDDEITMAMSGKHHKVAYCEAAEFFDEQPRDLKTSFTQRIRWAKGRLTNFFKYGGRVFSGILRYKSWTCYDMFTHYFPYGLFIWFVGFIYPAASFIAELFSPETIQLGGLALNLLTVFATQYAYALLVGILTVVREYRHIVCPGWKIALYTFTYPWFNMVIVPIYIIAIFKRVKWIPIVHTDSRKIDALVKK